jgi:colanic acid biosynthesis protein WcaH
MTDNSHVPEAAWATVVSHAPIVSVDLVVDHPAGVLLGKRTNEPAKGDWFVPGGSVRKHESLEAAVHRIAHEELGLSVSIRRQLGVYEHFYDVADVDTADGKHYVPIGYLVTAGDEALMRPTNTSPCVRFRHPSTE